MLYRQPPVKIPSRQACRLKPLVRSRTSSPSPTLLAISVGCRHRRGARVNTALLSCHSRFAKQASIRGEQSGKPSVWACENETTGRHGGRVGAAPAQCVAVRLQSRAARLPLVARTCAVSSQPILQTITQPSVTRIVVWTRRFQQLPVLLTTTHSSYRCRPVGTCRDVW